MKRPAWQRVAGYQWCQTCKEWIPPVEGGHKLDHFLDSHLDELLRDRDARQQVKR